MQRTQAGEGAPPLSAQGGAWEITHEAGRPPHRQLPASARHLGPWTIPRGDTGVLGHCLHFLSTSLSQENTLFIGTLALPTRGLVAAALPSAPLSKPPRPRRHQGDRIPLSSKEFLQVSHAIIHSSSHSFIHSSHVFITKPSLDSFSSVPKALGAVTPTSTNPQTVTSPSYPQFTGAGLMGRNKSHVYTTPCECVRFEQTTSSAMTSRTGTELLPWAQCAVHYPIDKGPQWSVLLL